MIRSETTFANTVREYFPTEEEARARADEIGGESSPVVGKAQNLAWTDEVVWFVYYQPVREPRED